MTEAEIESLAQQMAQRAHPVRVYHSEDGVWTFDAIGMRVSPEDGERIIGHLHGADARAVWRRAGDLVAAEMGGAIKR